MTLNPDGWLNTGMYGGVGYAMQWVGAYGWLSQHVWDHYDYTRDEDYLRRRAWPILTEALKFYMAYNRVNPETGKIQVGPSGSPENGFRHEGERVTTDYGVAIDQEIAWELSDHVLKAAKVLGIEDGFTARVREFQSKLALPAVNKEGRLLEWRDDREEVHPDHRHLSHLYGFQPGDRLSMLKTPELAAAVGKALERRLEGKPYGNIIWSKAWILCQWARLLDADKAFDQYLIGGLSRMCPNLVKPWTHVYCMDANGGFTLPPCAITRAASLKVASASPGRCAGRGISSRERWSMSRSSGSTCCRQ